MRKTTKARYIYTIICLFISLSFSGCASKSYIKQPYSDIQYFIAAHRGLHNDVPENSLASIHEAVSHGIDIIEIDIRVTKDGVPVLMHDSAIDRTTTGRGKVSGYYLFELKEFYLLFNNQATEERIPTLEEVLEKWAGTVLFDLDIKTTNIEPVMEAVEKSGAHESVIFFTGNWDTLDKIVEVHPNWHVMPRAYSRKQARQAYQHFRPWAVHVDPSFATPKLAKYLQKRGTHVWINALGNTDSELRKLNSRPLMELLYSKSNIIQTDVPVMMKDWVDRALPEADDSLNILVRVQ